MPPASSDRPAATLARSRLERLVLPGEVATGAREAGAARRPWPDALAGARLRLDRRSVVAIAVLCAAALGLAGWFVLRGSPVAVPAPPAVTVHGTPAGGSSAGSDPSSHPAATAAQLVIDVAGRVRRPGLVRLPAGSRVADALAAAGGVLRGVDLTTLNLARPLSDGEQVLVGVGGAVPAGTGGTGAGGAPGGLLDLNTATLEQLDGLPGVGPVLAQRILDWRTAHGRFTSIDELGEVGGLGEKKLADIRPKVRV